MKFTMNNYYLYLGGLLMLLHHNLLSCFFFFICGEFKYLTNSLDITIMKNMSKTNNKFFYFLFYGLLINMSFPISFAFMSELIFFSGLFLENILMIFLILIMIFFNTIYSFWLFNYMSYTDSYIMMTKNYIMSICKNNNYLNLIPLYFLLIIFMLIMIYCSMLIMYLM